MSSVLVETVLTQYFPSPCEAAEEGIVNINWRFQTNRRVQCTNVYFLKNQEELTMGTRRVLTLVAFPFTSLSAKPQALKKALELAVTFLHYLSNP